MFQVYAIYIGTLIVPKHICTVKENAEKYITEYIKKTGENWTLEFWGKQPVWVKENNEGVRTCIIQYKVLEIEGPHPDEAELREEIAKLKEENTILTRENNELKYMPGGPGYAEALADWNSRQS